MPSCDLLRELVNGVFLARMQRDLKTEFFLYCELVRIYRSPELMMRISGVEGAVATSAQSGADEVQSALNTSADTQTNAVASSTTTRTTTANAVAPLSAMQNEQHALHPAPQSFLKSGGRCRCCQAMVSRRWRVQEE